MTNLCFPLRRAFLLLLNVESVFLFVLSPPKQTYSIGYHWSYYIVRLNMNLYIDFTVGSWSFLLILTSSLFWFSNTFVMQLLSLWIDQICVSHCFHVFNVLFMKGFAWMIQLAFLLSTIDNCFVSLHSHPMLYITILTTIVLVACLIKNYFVITYLLEDE